MEHPATGNAVLDSIARAEPNVAGLLRGARLMKVEAGARLQQANDPVQFAYFPVAGVLSLYLPLEGGAEVHTSAVGSDGAIHACPGTSLDRASHHVSATLRARVLCINAAKWRDFVDDTDLADDVLSRYSASLLSTSHQALACQTMHDVESRLCRWLLRLHEWQDGHPIVMTHQGLAHLLSVRRTTITLIAGSLQNAGIISYTRGTIYISDLYALRQASCECCMIGMSWQNGASRTADEQVDASSAAH